MRNQLLRFRLAVTRVAVASGRGTVIVLCVLILGGCIVVVLGTALTGWAAYEGIQAVKKSK